MTENQIRDILNELFVVTINNSPYSQVDFFNGDKKIGYVKILIKEKRGTKKPIRQNYYLMDKFDMSGVLDYINKRIPINQGDFDILNKTIYNYCVEVINRHL